RDFHVTGVQTCALPIFLNPGGPETGALCPLVPPSCDAPWRIPLPLGHTGAKPDGPGFSCSLPWLDLLAKRLSRHIGSVTIRFPTREGIPMASVLLLAQEDRKSTRLNSSHVKISYAV